MVTNLELMRSFNLASQLVSRQFATELPQAFEMLTKVSIATGESMTYLMDSLVRGIGRLNPRILDNLGVQIDLNAAYKKFAGELGTTTEALTKVQKQTIAWMGTLERLKINTAALPDVTNTLAFQYAVLRTNIANVRQEIERSFAPVLTNLYRRMNELIEGPMIAFGNVMRNWVAPAIDVMIDRFGDLAISIEESMAKGADAFISQAKTMAWNAIVWGNNIMINFADGIIRGATTAITTAMRFVSKILFSWLAPGSPPKVAPGLGEWGAGAFTEYLKGFFDAQFSVLEGLQDPIKRALESLVNMGELAEEALGPAFVNVSKMLAATIPEMIKVGKISQEVIDTIRNSVGGYADEILDLLQKQLNLADAVDRVRIAEENLEASRKAHEAAKDRVRDIANEYNRLLAAGAGEDVLAPLRDQFKVARKGLGVTREQVKEAEVQKTEAEVRLGFLGDQVKLQERLLDQLFSMGEALKPIVESTAKAKKGIADIMDEIVVPEVPEGIDLSGGLDAQFQLMKDKINALIDELLAPWKEKWETEWKPVIDKALEDWDIFVARIKKAWDDNIKPIIDTVFPAEGFGANLREVGGAALFLAGALNAVMVAATIAKTVFGFLFGSLGGWLLVAGILIATFKTAWDNNWFGMRDTLTEFWEGTVKPAFIEISTWLQEKIPQAIKDVSDWWTGTFLPALEDVRTFLKKNMIPILAGVGAALLTAFVTVGIPAIIAWIGTMVTAAGAALASAGVIIASLAPIILPILAIGAAVGLLVAAWQNDWLGIRTTLTNAWENSIKPALMSVWTWLQEKIPQAIGTVVAWWNDTFLPALRGVWEFISVDLIGVFQTIWTWLTEKISGAVEAVSNVWTTVFLPAIQAVVSFFTDYYFPLFASVMNFFGAIGRLVIRFAVGIWEGILLPALKKIWAFILNVLQPVLDFFASFWTDVLQPALQVLIDWWTGTFVPAFEAFDAFLNDLLLDTLSTIRDFIVDKFQVAWENISTLLITLRDDVLGPLIEAWNIVVEVIKTAITDALEPLKKAWDDILEAMKKVKDWFDKIAGVIDQIQMPAWLQGKSPPPMAKWLTEIAGAARLAGGALGDMGDVPLISRSLRPGGNVGGVGTAYGDTFNFNQTVNTRATQMNTIRDFSMARALYGN